VRRDVSHIISENFVDAEFEIIPLQERNSWMD